MGRAINASLAVGMVMLAAGCGGAPMVGVSPHGPARPSCPTSPPASPVGTAARGPALSVLLTRAQGQPVRPFSFTQCFGTPKALTLASAGRVISSPVLRASLRTAAGAGFVSARVLGTTGYVDVSKLAGVPQIAGIAHHRRWLEYPVARSLRLPLNELYPERTVGLVASARGVRSLGRVHVNGTLAYGFQTGFAPARLGLRHAARENVAIYVNAAGEPIRIATSTQNLPGTNPPIVVTVEDIHPVNTPVAVTPPPASETQRITYGQARAVQLLP